MKTKAKIITTVIIVVAVLAGAGAACVFAGDYLINQFMLITKDEQGYFKWLSLKQVEAVKNRLDVSWKNNADGADSGTETLNMDLSVSNEFCDLLDLYYFKKCEIRTVLSHTPQELGLRVTPVYGGNELLSINALSDIGTKELYVQIPDYSSAAIDMSAVFDTETGAQIYEMIKSLPERLKKGEFTKKGSEASEEELVLEEITEYARYYSYLVNSIKNVSIEKKQEIEVDGAKIRCNIVSAAVSSDELKNQLTGLTNLAEEYGRISRSEADGLIDMISQIDSSVHGKLDIYVDKRGGTIGFRIGMSVKETEISAEINGLKKEEEDGRIVCKVSVNSLPALEITTSACIDEENGFSVDIEVKPGSFLRSFLKEYAEYVANISIVRDETSSQLTIRLKNGNTNLAEATVVGRHSGNTESLLELEGQRVYDYQTLGSSSYIDYSQLVGLLLDIREKIDESYIDDYLNGFLSTFMGDGMTVETIEGLYYSGLLGFLSTPDAQDYRIYSGGNDKNAQSGTVPAITSPTPTPLPSPSPSPTPTPTPTPEPVVPGITSVPPAEYLPVSYSYPDEGSDYYYSYDYLKRYCNPGRCEGIEYAVSLSGDISNKQYEEAQKNFLKGYEGAFTYDQNTITVQNGDEIYMDIVPLLAGNPITMYGYTDCYELVGSNQYGEGLDDSLLGMHVGEMRDVEATLDENYGDFAGYRGIFRVTLKQIIRPVIPEWTTEFICDRLQFPSLEACKETLMQELMSKVEFSEDSVAEVLTDILFDKAMFGDVSTQDMNRLRQECYDRFYDESIGFGMKPEKYYMTRLGYSFEEFLATLNHEATDGLKRKCFYAAICDDKGIYLKGTEAKALVDSAMKERGVSSFDELMKSVSLTNLINAELERRVARYIFDNAVLTYK